MSLITTTKNSQKLTSSSCSSKLLLLAKTSLILQTLLLSFISAADPKCTKIVKCASTNYITKDENQCIYFHKQTSSSFNTTTLNVFEYDNTKCKAGFSCQNPTQQQNYTCLQRPAAAGLFPGSACASGKQCASNECNNGLCAGKPENGTCTNANGIPDNKMCNAGLFCEKVNATSTTTVGNCKPQKGEGEACKDDYGCKNNLVCNELKCVKAFFLSVGAVATKEMACATNVKFYSEADKKSYCADFSLEKQNATHCDFVYNFNNVKVPKTIEKQCTETEDKDSYCPLASDSLEWKDMVKTLSKLVYSNEFINAHVTFRDDLGSFDKSLNQKIQPALQFPKFRGADECLIQLYLGAGFIKVGLFVMVFALFGVLAG